MIISLEWNWPMYHLAAALVLTVASVAVSTAQARVTPVAGGFEVSYDVHIHPGTSNGNAIQDTLILEWNDSGDFSADFGPVLAPRGRSLIRHEIDFEPTHALVLGWAAGIPGVGDEKDHLFTLNDAAFTRAFSGKKWSVAFPAVPPNPRIGHSAMIDLLKDAAGGDMAALDTIAEWAMRDAEPASFDPAGGFRVMEWSIGFPIDNAQPVPGPGPYGMVVLVLAMLILAHRFAPAQPNRPRLH